MSWYATTVIPSFDGLGGIETLSRIIKDSSLVAHAIYDEDCHATVAILKTEGSDLVLRRIAEALEKFDVPVITSHSLLPNGNTTAATNAVPALKKSLAAETYVTNAITTMTPLQLNPTSLCVSMPALLAKMHFFYWLKLKLNTFQKNASMIVNSPPFATYCTKILSARNNIFVFNFNLTHKLIFYDRKN